MEKDSKEGRRAEGERNISPVCIPVVVGGASPPERHAPATNARLCSRLQPRHVNKHQLQKPSESPWCLCTRAPLVNKRGGQRAAGDAAARRCVPTHPPSEPAEPCTCAEAAVYSPHIAVGRQPSTPLYALEASLAVPERAKSACLGERRDRVQTFESGRARGLHYLRAVSSSSREQRGWAPIARCLDA